MKLRSHIISGFLTLSLCSLSFSAHAKELTIVNNSDFYSTSFINGTMCSSTLSGGITQPHSTNVVADSVINLACLFYPTNCTADVYMTKNCSGLKVGTVVFDTKKGIKSIVNLTTKYKISGSYFRIQFDVVA